MNGSRRWKPQTLLSTWQRAETLERARFGVLWGYDYLREALPGHPSPVLPAPCPLWLLSLPQKLCNKFSLSLVSAAVLGMGRPQTWTPAPDVQP